MLVLGLESSCDETAVALYHSRDGLIGHRLYSQVQTHAKYGGVVPELASRDHIRKATPLLQELLQQCDRSVSDLDGVAYTRGPGLVGALLVGACIARSLAWSLKVPAVGIHHMEGHLLAPMLEHERPQFPFLALLVSGGHTLLVRVDEVGAYTVLGDTRDDAVGEAFDKTAKLLGLPYPGGPVLAGLAQQGDPERFTFPRPMTDRPGLEFSFSGLKTFAVNTLAKYGDDDQTKADIACAFQQAVVDTLAIKCKRALKQTGLKQLVIAGGVGANRLLRKRLRHVVAQLGARLFYPRVEFCTDNGAMIAYAGYLRLSAGQSEPPTIQVQPRWRLDELQVPQSTTHTPLSG